MYKSLPNISKADWVFIHVVSCISLVLRKRKYIFHIINFYLNCFVVQKFVFCTMRPTSYTSDVGCVLSTWGPVSNFFHGSCHFGKCKVGNQNLVNLFCSRTSLSRSPQKNKKYNFSFIHSLVCYIGITIFFRDQILTGELESKQSIAGNRRLNSTIPLPVWIRLNLHVHDICSIIFSPFIQKCWHLFHQDWRLKTLRTSVL